MKAILDTHALLWLTGNVSRLSDKAREVLEDDTVHLIVSIATLWEVTIKLNLGKLTIDGTLADLIERDIAGNMIEVLPISQPHLETFLTLPLHHRDPFDRMIIAQAMTEDLVVLSADTAFKAYEVELIW